MRLGILLACSMAATECFYMNNSRPRWSIVFVAGVLAVGGNGKATAQDYEIQGTVMRTLKGEAERRWCDVSIAVSGGRSIQWARYFNDESFVCGTDGEDSYLLNELTPAREKSPLVSQVGSITAGPFSTEASAPLQLTWLAFASTDYLTARRRGVIPLESFRDQAAYLDCMIERFRETPELPRSIRWSYPGRNPAAVFSAGPTTNFLGARVPLSWRFDFYGPDGTVMDVLRGVVTNVSRRSYSGTFRPTLPEEVRILDWRLESEIGFAISVPVVDGDWPRRNDHALQEQWRIYRAAVMETKRKAKGTNLFIWWPILAAGGVLVAMALTAAALVRRARTNFQSPDPVR